MRQRVQLGENGQVEFVLHAPSGAKKTRPVTITWRDIRELQLAYLQRALEASRVLPEHL